MSGRARSRKARADRRRRVRRVDNDLTDTEWTALQDAWGGCAYCGAIDRALQRDCVQPIRLGGRYTVTNVVPACGSCNASKGHHEVTMWMRRRRLDESSFLIRHREVLDHLAPRP
ncbi:MAG: HNH endonuclease [Actinomycetota bacterium]